VNHPMKHRYENTLSKPVDERAAGISFNINWVWIKRQPVFRRHELRIGFDTEHGNLSFWCEGRNSSGSTHENESTNTGHRDGSLRSSVEASVMEVERRQRLAQFSVI